MIDFLSENIVWAYCQAGTTPSPIVPTGKEPGTWYYANNAIKVNGYPLKWAADYPKAFDAHVKMGKGVVINTPETPLQYADIGEDITHTYKLYDPANSGHLHFVPAPPLGVFADDDD